MNKKYILALLLGVTVVAMFSLIFSKNPIIVEYRPPIIAGLTLIAGISILRGIHFHRSPFGELFGLLVGFYFIIRGLLLYANWLK